MSNKIIKIITYVSCVALIGWYLITLYWAGHPQVSNIYRMHYIDHMLSDWPGDAGLEYSDGSVLYFGRERKRDEQVHHRDQNWHKREDQYAWSKEKNAGLYLQLNHGRPVSEVILTFSAKGASEGNTMLQVGINGEPAGSVNLGAEFREYQINLQFRSSDDGMDHLIFSTDTLSPVKVKGKKKDAGFAMEWFKLDLN